MTKIYKRALLVTTIDKMTLETSQELITDLFDTSDELLQAVYYHVKADMSNAIVHTDAVRYSINPYTGGDMVQVRSYDSAELFELIDLAMAYIEDGETPTYDEMIDALRRVDEWVTPKEFDTFMDWLNELKA